MNKNMICIICPKGCSLYTSEDNGVITVSGNACPRGEKYAVTELTAPTRTVTAVVRVANRKDTMVSVKTEQPIPKEKIFDLMEIIKTKKLTAPIEIGQTICDNVFGTRVVATKSIK